MATIDNGAIIREMYDAFNTRDLERIRQLSQPNAKMFDVSSGVAVDYLDYVRNWMSGFGDARVDVIDVVAQGNKVAAEFNGSGTHTGPLESASGVIPATNRRVAMRFCEVYEIRDGKIAGGTSYYDAATMLRMLGIAPEVMLRGAARGEAAEQEPLRH